MTIKIKIKEVREQKGISLRKLEEDTGIERKRLSEIENNEISAEQISLAEMIVIAENLVSSIMDLYELENIEIKGIGEI